MSPRRPRLTGRDAERVLARHGFALKSQRGSHRKWKQPATGRIVVVPSHGNKPLPIGTLRSIVTGSGLPQDAWENAG